ncbi:hypothetical protein CAOG_03743 [Capsaspora owczarzaki ATCC 30864]|uniref:hypothetical protein n=1 Tax=Capsaspora owczarzaki (strain ATCC 30864) TaxID=595528 RepID=UPI00035208C7|nr:hypothetical protein CAOG_03743 [Capsaspora owczarzaki ATCC 30864]|eukprot:XP_004363471.2 hypothetical protein CAOG_03743 [Capsaspora owczarzaki ATCC 30864]
MGQLFFQYLSGRRVYACAACQIHLTRHDDIVSKAFHGTHGRAYLFEKVVNVQTGEPVERPMTTGIHIIKAYEESQKYKEGKVILEKALINEVDESALLA